MNWNTSAHTFVHKFMLGALLGVLILTSSQAYASDKYGGGSSTNVSSSDGRTSIRTNTTTGATDVYNRDTRTTTSYRDYNGDGDTTDPNEQMSTRDSSGNGSSGSSGSTPPPCTGIDIAVTNVRFETPGQSTAAAPSRTSQLFGGQRNTSLYTSVSAVTPRFDAVTGGTYVPVVTVQNIGCRPTNYTGATTPASGNRFTSILGSRAATTAYFKDELPFGAAGGFPVQLSIDIGGDGSFETVEYTLNQGPLVAGRAITLRFPAVTIGRDGNYVVRAIADPTIAQAPANTCAAGTLGDWGCVRESDRGTNNVRTLTVRATTPSVMLGSFIVSTAPVTTGWWTSVITDASTANTRDISALTNRQEVGLYWTGQLVDFGTCTGNIQSQTGDSLSGFAGRRDTAGLSLWGLLRLPTDANRVDTNIPEPGQDERYTYTIACRTSVGTTVSDSLSIIRGNPPLPVDPVVSTLDPACRDGIDNDADIQVDSTDPGCWDDPTDPTTYDPDRPSEAFVIGGDPTISVDPEIVRRGEFVQVTWNPMGNSGCAVSGGNINTPIPASSAGSQEVQVDTQATFRISCPSGAEAETTVKILPVIYES